MEKHHFRIPIIVLVLVAVLISLTGCWGSDRDEETPDKAAIIDQLYLLEPNPLLIDSATQTLEAYGFKVDLWQGADVTVDFYHKLPAMGYKFILFRVHSGLITDPEGDGAGPPNATYLFTTENYTTTKYVTEQLTDKVSGALMYQQRLPVFAVNSVFIETSEGRFDNTVALLMGCESYYYDDLAAAFIEKGASAYIGWSTVVSLEHVDKTALDLLDNLCADYLSLAESVSRTMADLGPDPSFGAYLKYYTSGSAGETIRELIEGDRDEN